MMKHQPTQKEMKPRRHAKTREEEKTSSFAFLLRVGAQRPSRAFAAIYSLEF